MMTEEQVLAYEAMSLAGQITFLKQLQSGMMGFREDVNERLESAEENSSSEEERKQNKTTSELLTLVREMKDDVQKKEGELKIIQFQEVEELGHLHHSIKSFLNSNKFDEAIGSMAEILDNKFSLILDASNKTLANLTHAITSQFTLKSGGETVTVGGLDEEAETELMGTRTVEVPEDYKLLYVFNNTANSNDSAITQSMHKFMEHNSSYLDLLKKEVRLMTELEHVTLLLFGGIKGHASMLNEKYKKTNEYINQQVTLPINITNTSSNVNAHAVIKSSSIAAGHPYPSKGAGKNLV